LNRLLCGSFDWCGLRGAPDERGAPVVIHDEAPSQETQAACARALEELEAVQRIDAEPVASRA